MKRKLFSTLATLALAALPFASARAGVVYNETFNYIDGISYLIGTNAPGVTNWFVHSGSGDSFIANKRLFVSMNASADVNRPFYTGGSGGYTNTLTNIYGSFTVLCTNAPAQSNYFAHFQSSATAFQGRVWNGPGSSPGTWKLGITTASSTIGLVKWFPADLATNVSYQVVVNWDETQGASSIASLWVNPVSVTDTPIVAGDASAGVISVAFGFRQPTGGSGRFYITNLVIATSFDEAATNVWKRDAVTPVIAYSPKGATNYVGNQVFLSGVAAGQGQGSMTYTWLKNGSPFANPDGNTNTLNFPSAQITDSGNYQLVATTPAPYSLSVTSAIATVLVSAAPVPPTITAQPANTTVYYGQSATLSVAAIGPGTITYTWLTNGIPVSGTPNIDGPTLIIPNVQLNNGTTGTYRCAVSNEYGGVLSSNAVVSAVPIPAVSIAYLRTLVDGNYLATNSTAVWQATGTVTTFTNLTTGNTASYYLQDGTAGINIFATLASTFRPALGDVVTFVGVLSSFNSTLELLADTANNPVASYTILSNNIANLPAPVVIPFSITNNLAFCETNLEGRLVTITNVYFGTNAGTQISTTANQTVVVTNAAGETFNVFFSFLDQDTAGQTLPEFAYSVTGPLTQNLGNTATPRNAGYSVTVTRFSDIVTTAPQPPPTLTITQSGSAVTISWPVGISGYVLEDSGALPGSWAATAGVVNNSVTLTSPAGNRFYRLKKP